MPVTNGVLPNDVFGTKSNSGYVPNIGVTALQLGAPTSDGQNQQSAPLIVQQAATSSVNGTLQSAAGANGNGTALALLGSASIIFTVNMSGFTGTVNFECTEDNTNYDPLQTQREGTDVIASSVTGSTTTAIHLYEASVAGLQSVRARVSGFSAGTVTVTAHAIPTTDASRTVNAVFTHGQKATYSYSASALTAQATHTDMMVLRGSATKTIRVLHFECSGAATAATGTVWFLKKHTIANTGGTGTLAATATQHDSNDPAATAVINTYQTTLPTVDASATTIRSIRFDLAVAPAAQAYATDRYVQDFGVNGGEPLILRGVAQEFALNLGGGAIPSGEVVDFSITWSEE